VRTGTVVAMRTVRLENQRIGATGGIIGAIVGGVVGNRADRHGHEGTAVGAVAGAVIGGTIENAVTKKKNLGAEIYVRFDDSGEVFAVVQKDALGIRPGDPVFVLYGQHIRVVRAPSAPRRAASETTARTGSLDSIGDADADAAVRRLVARSK
jgi:outer membrane lipoprotein SlyB